METRARKRVRVADYEYDDEVAERSTKRIKQEKKVKQEVKKEPKIKREAKIKSEASNKNIKSEKKSIKSEVKSEVKAELKKEKKEKKIKPESKIKIKTEPGLTNETTDHASESREENSEDEGSNDQSSEGADISDENDEDFIEEEGLDHDELVKRGKGRYNFASFKTILRKKADRWTKASDQKQQKINSNLIEKIISFSEVPQIMIWTRVSKSTSNLVHGSQSMWQEMFKDQQWRLPHEIRNNNFRFKTSEKRIPQLKISNEKVDWFNEFKRNYIACSAINNKLEKIFKSYKKKYPEYKDTDERMEEEAIQEWEEENNFFLPNDLREYFLTSRVSFLDLDLENIFNGTVPLSRVYRMPKPSDASDEEEDEFEEDDTVTDLDSLSKLLDIPKSGLKDEITGILIMDITRNGGMVFVPYINMFMEVEGDEPAFIPEAGEKTVLQMIKFSTEHLKD